MGPDAMLVHLRKAGLTVHHATWRPGHGRGSALPVVLIFLEGLLGEAEQATELLGALPAVASVSSSAGRTILHVRLAG